MNSPVQLSAPSSASPSEARAARGTTIIGGFEILEKVGQGSMGAVFRARQISMDRIVAIKILPPKLAMDSDFKNRFMHEARISAKLSHINIINGIDCGDCGGYTFFAMEFVDGQTVKQILKARGQFPVDEAVSIVRQITQALIYAKQQRLVHRDIKPDNIMVTPSGVAKLCDLGLARQTHATEDANMLQVGLTVGTPHYISPEQVRGEKDVDFHSDIYSLGATFFHILVGKPLFEGPTNSAVMSLHVTNEVPNPCDIVPNIPIGYGQIISKMMAKNATDRYNAPEELLEDLDIVQNGDIPKAAVFQARTSCAMPRATRDQTSETTTLNMSARTTSKSKNAMAFLRARVPMFVVLGLLLIGVWLVTGLYSVGDKLEVAQIEPQPEPPPLENVKQSETNTLQTLETQSQQPPILIEPEPSQLINVELPPPKLELTADVFYTRFLRNFSEHCAKTDLAHLQVLMTELARKPEYKIAQADIAADLADLTAAINFEREALTAMAARGDEVELTGETARKFGSIKAKIASFDPTRGLELQISGARFGVTVQALSLNAILESLPKASVPAKLQYLITRGEINKARVLAMDLSEPDKSRWERKLDLMASDEIELIAKLAFDNLNKMAVAKSWKTLAKMIDNFDKIYGHTRLAKQCAAQLRDWKEKH
ncbi:MAG: serine/threonine-protein kinase [Planctomycetota bacterium]